jgi:glutamyl-tRNA reductase
MTTINLAPELVEQIESLAETAEVNAELLVEKAVRAYLLQLQREKIQAETEAFNEQREKLLSKYMGQYIAMHQGKVVDHDPDLRTLHLRVFERLGHTPVLLKRVSDEPKRELIFRSPRLEAVGQ